MLILIILASLILLAAIYGILLLWYDASTFEELVDSMFNPK